ncbi:hypothetical protein ACIPJK_36075 [Streptomyces roseus]|uniref:hypothetical protein n=1 Tax=Streptomyces TaxID=1883 RepID=UPI0013E911A6|nr:hypothetical protein [Streptomyces sp. M3]
MTRRCGGGRHGGRDGEARAAGRGATEAYGAAKNAAGRMDVFHRLFENTGDDDLPWNG